MLLPLFVFFVFVFVIVLWSCYCRWCCPLLLIQFFAIGIGLVPVRWFCSCCLLLFLLLLLLSSLVVGIVIGGLRVRVTVPCELFLLCGIVPVHCSYD